MSEEEIINEFKSIIDTIYLQGFIKDNNGEITILLKNLYDLYKREKEERKKFEKAFKQRMTYSHELEEDLFENCSNYVISKAKIRYLIAERKFELQQEYEDFENDIKLKILEELLEE